MSKQTNQINAYKKENKERINFELDKGEKLKITERAKELNMSPSDYIKQQINIDLEKTKWGGYD